MLELLVTATWIYILYTVLVAVLRDKMVAVLAPEMIVLGPTMFWKGPWEIPPTLMRVQLLQSIVAVTESSPKFPAVASMVLPDMITDEFFNVDPVVPFHKAMALSVEDPGPDSSPPPPPEEEVS